MDALCRALALLAFVLAPPLSLCQDRAVTPSATADEVERLIGELYMVPYNGPWLATVSPTIWRLRFTEPMQKLLEVGPAAQDALLSRLPDPRIKEQIIMVLGGLGDEHAVTAVIDAMVPASQTKVVPNAETINLCANLALTNITLADVAWYHKVGGTIFLNCPHTPKECWAKWWKQSKKTFRARDITEARNYGYYPNDGLYQTR